MKSLSFILFIAILYLLSITLNRNKYYVFKRDDFNSLKGILSILIILSHVSFFVDWPQYKAFIQWGGTRVGVYFFISGYGLMAAKLNKGTTYFDGFFAKRLPAIINPLFFITAFYLFLSYLDTGVIPTFESIKSIFLAGDTPLPFSWFAYVIIFVYIFFFYIFNNKRSDLINILFITLCILVLSFSFHLYGLGRGWWVSNLAFPVGLLFKLYEEKIILYSRRRLAQILFVPFSLAVALAIVYINIEELYILAYAFIIFPTMILLSYVKIPTGPFFTFLGNISYPIYLIHGAVLVFLRGNHIFIVNKYMYIVTAVCVTVLLAFLYKKLSDRFTILIK